MTGLGVPPGLERVAGLPGGPAWLEALPRLVAACARRWALDVGPAYPDSALSFVAPARRGTGEAVLKIPFPHRETEHEAAALAAWDGNGAVRLHAYDPDRHALLLERCVPGSPLSAVGEERALEVLSALLPGLWRPAGEPFRPLSDEATGWALTLPSAWERSGRPFERSLVDAVVEHLADLAATQGAQVLLHQDLHPGNVLRAGRRPWLAIDPKPLAGEREFSLAPVVRAAELGADPGRAVPRLDRLAGELGLDRDRAGRWAMCQTLAWAFDGDRVLERHVAVARLLRDAVG